MPVPPAGLMTQWGLWSIQGNGVSAPRSPDGLGFFILPAIAGGYAVYWGCKNGLLPASSCNDVGIAPGPEMPGTCPDAYKLDGKCFCPAGSELPDGGCSYPGAYTVGADGALPIGGGGVEPAASPSGDKWLIAAGAFAILVGAYAIAKKK